jgi:hypothetical protein
MSRNQLFIEKRQEGGYAVRKPNSQRASIVTETQAEAIDWAQDRIPDDGQILVERVKYTNHGKPDQWRKP